LKKEEQLEHTAGQLEYLSREQQLNNIKILVDAGCAILGFKPKVQFTYHVNCEEHLKNVEQFSKVRDVWTSCSYSTTKYRRKFDLFTRPKDSSNSVSVFPYACARRYMFSPDVPLLAINIVHTPTDSWVEFQSARGAAWIEEAATILGQPVEIWEGPQEERWGWYRTPSPGNHVRIFDPSIHTAEVPVYDID
jgi:hypothetical protein